MCTINNMGSIQAILSPDKVHSNDLRRVLFCEPNQSTFQTAGLGVCAEEVGATEGALLGQLHFQQNCGGQSDM